MLHLNLLCKTIYSFFLRALFSSIVNSPILRNLNVVTVTEGIHRIIFWRNKGVQLMGNVSAHLVEAFFTDGCSSLGARFTNSARLFTPG